MLQIVQAFDRAPIAEIPTDDAAALEAKLEAATQAFRDRNGWPKPHERIAVLRRIAGLVEHRREHFAQQIAREGGKPLSDAIVEVGRAIDGVLNAAGELRKEFPPGTNRSRPGLDQALAAVRTGDTLVVPKLDRLARSVPDARTIADALVARGVKLALGSSVYDPADPMGKMFFNILATFAEFEADLIRLRTREGMAVARARGKLKGKQPKLSDRQQKELRRMHDTGDYSISDLAELFSVSRPTV